MKYKGIKIMLIGIVIILIGIYIGILNLNGLKSWGREIFIVLFGLIISIVGFLYEE
jgi:hypothetical protein